MTVDGTFTLWAFGDAHVATDLRHGRESLAESLRMSERGGDAGGPPFEWDIALDVGDVSGAMGLCEDWEGEEIARQFQVLRDHPREAIYNLCGNHDRSAPHEPPAMWWKRWVDPLGENTGESGVDAGRRPYPIDGTWERYSFRVGNVLFLVMSDVNEPTQTIGRGELGGNPGGVVTGETFAWWKEMVLANPDSIIITAHHYVLKETTVASGLWEGMRRTDDGGWRTHYHGYHPEGTPQGASFLYWVDSHEDSAAFEDFLEANPGSVDLWLAGHTHTHPDDTYGGKSHLETRYGGTHFCNVSSLTRHHVKWSVPKSRVLTFTEGSADVLVRCYMHTDEFKPQGWYEEDERLLTLSRPFTRNL